jgi:nitroimidazol reductase NimA-like FMN-containing flavoprotein (pyridoxamine 5'-phosphate oxidase superfamily)
MTDHPLTHIRRQDRAITDQDWIENFLARAAFGVTASAIDGQPFVTTNLFVYDPQRKAIYLHSSDEGRTAANLKANPRVCFTTAEMGRLLPAPRSRGFSVEYCSVVAFCAATVLENVDEKLYGLRLLMAKYAPHLVPGEHYAILGEDELEGVAVYRLDVETWSAKRKQAPEDFPGAYPFKP